MKQRLFLLLTATSLSLSNIQAQTRHALLVGAADYPEETKWGSPLASKADVDLMKAALHVQGYQDEHITTLVNPTKVDLVEAIRALTGRVQEGDVALFHFSGHGQPVIDMNGDEPTGLDQSLVPVDAYLNAGTEYVNASGIVAPYFGENHLIDDELAVLMSNLRAALTSSGQLVCVLDACHSGSSTRAPGMTRGAVEIMRTAPDVSMNRQSVSARESWMDESSGQDNLSPLVAFYACASNEKNQEHRLDDGKKRSNVGSLSFAFASTMHQVGPSSTWSDALRLVVAKMGEIVPGQTPYADGNALTSAVFNGSSPSASSNAHLYVQDIAGDTVRIHGGQILNVYPGATLELTDPTSNLRALAEVVESDLMNSVAVLAKGSDFHPLPDSLILVNVRISLPSMGTQRKVMWSCDGCSADERRAIRQSTASLSWFVPSKTPKEADVHCLLLGESTEWRDVQGTLLFPPVLLKSPELQERIEKWAKVQELRFLNHESKRIQVDLKATILDSSWTPLPQHEAPLQISDNNLELTVNPQDLEDGLMVNFEVIRNAPSQEPLYYTLLLIDGGEVHHLHGTNLDKLSARKLDRSKRTGPAGTFPFAAFNTLSEQCTLKLIVTNKVTFDVVPYYTNPSEELEDTSDDVASRGVSPLDVMVKTYSLHILKAP